MNKNSIDKENILNDKEKVLNYLYSLERFGIKLGLDITLNLAALLNNPHKQYKTIHITGTNGKGSTASFIATILKKAGYKVGLYTSPHLIRFNERIKINNLEIEDKEIISLTQHIKTTTEQHHLQPTFFEFTTMMAFLYFAQQKVDIAVIEVGMGGEYDATNIITPLVSIITNIDYDHEKYLGNTKELIAKTKAGIIKENIPCITAEENSTILSIFEQECNLKNSTLYQVKNIIKATKKATRLEKEEKQKFISQTFSTTGKITNTFKIRLLGKHQIINAATALSAINILQNIKSEKLNISLKAIKNGLEETTWPGRLHIINTKPVIIIDGAHNLAGMKTLQQFLSTTNKSKNILIGIAKDKPIEKMLSYIAPNTKTIIISQGNYKPAPMNTIVKHAKKYTHQIYCSNDVEKAIKIALLQTKDDELLLITGSLYFIGDVLKHKELLQK